MMESNCEREHTKLARKKSLNTFFQLIKVQINISHPMVISLKRSSVCLVVFVCFCSNLSERKPINQSIKQTINLLTNQPTNQSIYQPTNQPINLNTQPSNQSINQSLNQPQERLEGTWHSIPWNDDTKQLDLDPPRDVTTISDETQVRIL